MGVHRQPTWLHRTPVGLFQVSDRRRIALIMLSLIQTAQTSQEIVVTNMFLKSAIERIKLRRGPRGGNVDFTQRSLSSDITENGGAFAAAGAKPYLCDAATRRAG